MRKNDLATLGLAGLLSSGANATLYDNFSSGSLNPALWSETISGNPLFVSQSEHEVRLIQGDYKYDVYARGGIDTSTIISLSPSRNFLPGEKLSCEINFTYGSGATYFTQIKINNQSSGFIGHGQNIGDGNLGTSLGRHLLDIEFGKNNVEVTSTTSYGSIFNSSINNLLPNYNVSFDVISFAAETGFNFDNFYINEVPSPSSALGLGAGALVGLMGARRRRKR